MCYLTVLEVRNPKIKVWAMFYLEGLRENPFPCLSQHLAAICTSWLVASSPIFKANGIASSDLSLSL